MKTKFKSFILFLFTGLFLVSCSKDMDDEPSLLGSWVEEAPQEDRTELFFLDYSRVFKSEAGTEGKFEYRVDGDSIYLRQGTNEESYYFRQIDENSFQIENLYAPDTIAEITYM